MTAAGRRYDTLSAERGHVPPSAIGSGVDLVFRERGDDRCLRPITLRAYLVADPDEGRVWWTRFPDTGQQAIHPVGALPMDTALYEFRMAICRYRHWAPAPKAFQGEPAAPAPSAVQPPMVVLLQAVATFWRTFERAPSNLDLLRMTGYRSTSSIGYHLRVLEDAGYVTRKFYRHRSTEITPSGRRLLAAIEQEPPRASIDLRPDVDPPDRLAPAL